MCSILICPCTSLQGNGRGIIKFRVLVCSKIWVYNETSICTDMDSVMNLHVKIIASKQTDQTAVTGTATKRLPAGKQKCAGGVVSHVATKLMPFQGDATEVIEGMRRGISAQVVPRFAALLGVSQDKLFEQLRLPKSTIKGRISKNDTLSASEQDRMYRADRVWKRAVEVLEDEDSARKWINQENRSLGGECPLSLLDTEAGYELVLDTLGRIEYGVVA